jgi:hypothetical protein
MGDGDRRVGGQKMMRTSGKMEEDGEEGRRREGRCTLSLFSFSLSLSLLETLSLFLSDRTDRHSLSCKLGIS